MGVTDSKLAKRAVKYGVLGEVGAVIGVTAGSRGNAQHPPVVVVVGADVLDQYNAITGKCSLHRVRRLVYESHHTTRAPSLCRRSEAPPKTESDRDLC